MSDKDPKQSIITTNIKTLKETLNSLYIPMVSNDKEMKDSLEKYSHSLETLISQVVGTRSIPFPPSLLENKAQNKQPSLEELEEYGSYMVSL